MNRRFFFVLEKERRRKSLHITPLATAEVAKRGRETSLGWLRGEEKRRRGWRFKEASCRRWGEGKRNAGRGGDFKKLCAGGGGGRKRNTDGGRDLKKLRRGGDGEVKRNAAGGGGKVKRKANRDLGKWLRYDDESAMARNG
ncbi:uncharacterized protein LOC111491792 [Cucurbita maxima]|uniref:Uncharacterized protein LOC111491792 n=1 Tax=Cucurbita maxima TaxID=3661 RepID=A0A6J1K799_CUCMA|nr:uncharacterized protein LOC111491792 [Cucurbita maxima]